MAAVVTRFATMIATTWALSMLMNADSFQREDADAQRISTTDGPRAPGKFALHLEFAEHGGRAPSIGGRPQELVGVGNRAGTQAVALMPI